MKAIIFPVQHYRYSGATLAVFDFVFISVDGDKRFRFPVLQNFKNSEEQILKYNNVSDTGG